MPDRGTSNLKLRGRRRLSDRECPRRGPVSTNQSNQSNQSRCRFLAGLPPYLPSTRGDPQATELGVLGTVYRVAQSWVEVWIGPGVATPRSWAEYGSAMGWQMSPVHGAAQGHAAASGAELVRTPSLPTKRQSHPPKHLGRLGQPGRAAACGPRQVRPWGPLASDRWRRVGAD